MFIAGFLFMLGIVAALVALAFIAEIAIAALVLIGGGIALLIVIAFAKGLANADVGTNIAVGVLVIGFAVWFIRGALIKAEELRLAEVAGKERASAEAAEAAAAVERQKLEYPDKDARELWARVHAENERRWAYRETFLNRWPKPSAEEIEQVTAWAYGHTLLRLELSKAFDAAKAAGVGTRAIIEPAVREYEEKLAAIPLPEPKAKAAA